MSETEACSFCREVAPLRDSHVLPAFAYRWLRRRSGTGHIRHTDNPNRRVQDGPKLKWLRDDCEGLFGKFETAFATNVFHPWQEGKQRVLYEDWLIKFCVSVSWRVLKYLRQSNSGARYTADQLKLQHDAECRWRAYLQGEAENPGKFEQHLLIFDNIESTTVRNLPRNINRFMTGAITFDIVGSQKSLMTFAKLGRFTIFGMIDKGPYVWKGTKVNLKRGELKPGEVVVPGPLLDLFRSKASSVDNAMQRMSPTQLNKIEDHVMRNLDRFRASDQFRSIEADKRMFGIGAVTRKSNDHS
jgi:hypothetical protein